MYRKEPNTNLRRMNEYGHNNPFKVLDNIK